MKEKPWHFNLLAIFLVACGLSIPLQVAIMHELHLLYDAHIVLQQIQPMGWIFVGFCLWAAVLMYQASNQLIWVVPALFLYTGAMNAFSIDGGHAITVVNVAIVTLGFYAPFGLLFMQSPAKVLNDPEAKWWAHPERKRVHLPMTITAPFTQAFSVNSYDISLGGAFISLKDIDSSMNNIGLTGKRSGIKVGDLLNIKIQSGRFTSIYCQGRVARIQETAKGEYPKGIGIQFLHVKKRDKKRLQQILDELERLRKSA